MKQFLLSSAVKEPWKPANRYSHQGLLFFLFFFAFIYLCPCISVSSQATTSTKTNTKAPTWPTPQQLQIIQERIDSYPLEKQLKQVQRHYYVNNQEVHEEKTIYNITKDFSQTTFKQEVKFFLTRFNQPVSFILCVFTKPVIFSDVSFEAMSNFEWAIFKENASFSYSKFDYMANFYQTVFSDDVDFYSVKFNHTANFTDANFNGIAAFSRTRFATIVDFMDVDFAKNAVFNDVTFGERAGFARVIFNSDVNFSRAKFGKVANFSFSRFRGNTLFYNTQLPDYLDFSHIMEIAQPIELNNINKTIEKITYINLIGTDISKVKLDYNFFTLYFPSEANDSQIRDVYENLLKVQKDNEFTDGYKKLSVEFKTYDYMANRDYIRYFFDKNIWYFGFEKSRLILIVVYLILFFSIINNFFYSRLEHGVYHIPFLNVQSGSKVIEKNFVLRYIFYFPISVLYTSLIMLGGIFGFQAEFKEIKKESFFFSIFFVLMVISGFISTFLILQYILH
ncbi:Uncharacterised protein [Legionella lansingensis]|uniref:Pentapeptide repeat-containing protein n=1 Tax=Legionella lansingensis TaxID=45067 RepID=A0A0W0VTH8_9GAMM|nr:pentapeptide repeat-containing protein [Legionella lansingensis]KTD23467.1 hypothetical protein Llan_0838 [Legionella lansingensis]SNV50819.1 Uncharacterised protein [Legionella lansingensis]